MLGHRPLVGRADAPSRTVWNRDVSMNRAQEFDAFYAQTQPDVLHQTYAMTGHLGAATAATNDAYVHLWRRWRVLRGRDTEAVARQEAWRLSSLRRTAHLRRRLDDPHSDPELLAALAELPRHGRKMLVLRALTGRDPATLAREAGLTDEAAARAGDDAAARILRRLDIDAASLDARLLALREVTDPVPVPPAEEVRRRGGGRQRRAAAVAAVATTLAVAGSGALVTSTAEGGQEATLASDVQVTAEPPKGAEADQLIDEDQVTRLNPDAEWRVTDTSTAPLNVAVFALCNQDSSADPQHTAAYVQTYEVVAPEDNPAELAVEATEVSKTRDRAKATYDRLVSWYAGCQAPRVQLLESFTMRRYGENVTVLELRKWSTPLRSMTVAVTRTGYVTTVLAHEVDGSTGPAPADFEQSVRDVMAMVCPTSGGGCGPDSRMVPVAPPPTGEALGFLGTVDLPPIAAVETPWVGTDAGPAGATTLCERGEFDISDVRAARERTFLLPQESVPTRFGLTQTVGFLPSDEAARRFVGTVAGRIDACPETKPSVTIDSTSLVRGGGGSIGRQWQLTYQLPARQVTYRLGLVRNGAAVTQLTFSPTPGFDIDPSAFNRLLQRAGQRLDELG